MCQDLWQGLPYLSLHLLCTLRSFPLPLLRSFLFSSVLFLFLTFILLSSSFSNFLFLFLFLFYISFSLDLTIFHPQTSSSSLLFSFFSPFLGIRFLNSVGKQNNIHLITSAAIAIWRDKSLSVDPRGHLSSGQKPIFRGHSKAEVYNGGMKFWTDHFLFSREELDF